MVGRSEEAWRDGLKVRPGQGDRCCCRCCLRRRLQAAGGKEKYRRPSRVMAERALAAGSCSAQPNPT